jgi:hypothetical protein
LPKALANFEAVVAEFEKFLQTNLYPGRIMWVQSEDVLLTGKRLVYVRIPAPKARAAAAQKIYESGMERGLGVLLGTICELDGMTCCHVWAPSNEQEAEESLMPAGVKMSVRSDKITGIPVKNHLWWFCLRIQYRRHQALREQLFR